MFALPVLGAYCYEKQYHVLVASRPDDKQLDTWRKGVVLDDGYRTKPVKVRVLRNQGKAPG